MQTAEAKATVINTKQLNSKRLEAEDLSIQGENVLDIIDANSLKVKDLVNRIDVGADEYYVIWDDTGTNVEMKVPLEHLPSFEYTNISHVEGDLSKIKSLAYRFNHCANLKEFIHPEINNCTSLDNAFNNCSNLEHFEIGNESIEKCTWINGCFSGTKIDKWELDLPNCKNAATAFSYCKNFTHFNSSLPKATAADAIFALSSIISFISKDSSLIQSGNQAFSGCKNLITFETNNLDSLRSANDMFKETILLTSFNYELPSLTSAAGMFQHSGLTEFHNNILLLSNGSQMFNACKNFSTFSSKLPSLTNGNSMFNDCILNKESVINIINTLKNDNQCENSANARITIGINSNLKTDEELLNFLGISSGINQNITVTNPKGINWAISLQWNNPSA